MFSQSVSYEDVESLITLRRGVREEPEGEDLSGQTDPELSFLRPALRPRPLHHGTQCRSGRYNSQYNSLPPLLFLSRAPYRSSISLSVYVCLSACPFVRSSIYLSNVCNYLSIYPSVHLFLCKYIYIYRFCALYVYLSLCSSLYPSMSFPYHSYIQTERDVVTHILFSFFLSFHLLLFSTHLNMFLPYCHRQ
jgi:hypothetical protein